MDKPIQVGDLVWVAIPRKCCGGNAYGRIFRLLETKVNWTFCTVCGDRSERNNTTTLAKIGDEDIWIEISRLKRLPPLDELEGQRTEENLKVPA